MSEKQNETAQPGNRSELMIAVIGNMKPMVRTAKSHFGKYVKLEQMLPLIQEQLAPFNAAVSFEIEMSDHVSTHRVTTKKEGGRVDKSGNPTSYIEEKDVTQSGAMTVLSLNLLWGGKLYPLGSKFISAMTNPQDEGKAITYFSRYLLITAFALEIVMADPDDPNDQNDAPVQPVQRKRRKMSDMNT